MTRPRITASLRADDTAGTASRRAAASSTNPAGAGFRRRRRRRDTTRTALRLLRRDSSHTMPDHGAPRVRADYRHSPGRPSSQDAGSSLRSRRSLFERDSCCTDPAYGTSCTHPDRSALRAHAGPRSRPDGCSPAWDRRIGARAAAWVRSRRDSSRRTTACDMSRTSRPTRRHVHHARESSHRRVRGGWQGTSPPRRDHGGTRHSAALPADRRGSGSTSPWGDGAARCSSRRRHDIAYSFLTQHRCASRDRRSSARARRATRLSSPATSDSSSMGACHAAWRGTTCTSSPAEGGARDRQQRRQGDSAGTSRRQRHERDAETMTACAAEARECRRTRPARRTRTLRSRASRCAPPP